ncbi:uncharacterized protein CEXT_536471 [Caerostris extrusa]|uniref:Uncharacterized protein n=1 Tax=Caerostris extrusa TaxID=172846 RepID=A0AAV4SHI3_CAEEX|nr:uncharacterized protein CEXT_536471 [Caerostris extrusa]
MRFPPTVPYREAPRYNPRRRTSAANMGTSGQNHSDPRLELVLSGGNPSLPLQPLPAAPIQLRRGIPHSVSGEDDAADESSGPVVNHSNTGEFPSSLVLSPLNPIVQLRDLTTTMPLPTITFNIYNKELFQ